MNHHFQDFSSASGFMRFFQLGLSRWPQTFQQYFVIEFLNIYRFISFYLFHYSPVWGQRSLRLQKMSLFSLSLKWYLKVVLILQWQKCWFNETNLEFFETDHLWDQKSIAVFFVLFFSILWIRSSIAFFFLFTNLTAVAMCYVWACSLSLMLAVSSWEMLAQGSKTR